MGTPTPDPNKMDAVLRALKAGDIESSEAPLRDHFEASREKHGVQHAETAQSAFILGMMLMNLGKPTEGLEYLLECYNIRKAVLGTRDSSTAVTLRIVAGFENDLRMWDEAAQHFQECINMAVSNLGKESETVLELRHHLISTLERAEQWPAMEQELRTLIGDLKTIKGPGHESTVDAQVHLALILKKMGRLEESEAILDEPIPETSLVSNSASTVPTQKSMD